MTHACEACSKEYTTRFGGTARLCATCYTRQRRGGLKRETDPDRGRRTVALQLWWTPEEFAEIQKMFPEATQRAQWARRVLIGELGYRALRKAIRGGA